MDKERKTDPERQASDACAGPLKKAAGGCGTDGASLRCADAEAPCCGGPARPAGPQDRPGYRRWHFVDGFLDTPCGPVPCVRTELARADWLGAARVRLGLKRMGYSIAPGLYAVGAPDSQSPVLVTANYKLTFDALRRELGGLDVWILVVDTHGVNVWCAAGKGTFSAEETARRVSAVGLDKVVAHRELILPQLAAPGVAAGALRKACGFGAVFGPVRARDIRAYLEAGKRADGSMRRVTFSLAERLTLVPVELYNWRKTVLWAALVGFVLSGFGPGTFSLAAAWSRGLLFALALAAGTLGGGVAAPALLPWLPGRAFSVKGAVAGFGAGLLALWAAGGSGLLAGLALVLAATAVGSWLGMQFTGATPYTSPSGVEKEMRRAIPLQLGACVASAAVWIGSAFAG